ncbi:MAG: MATE family efflux transporter [Eubacterium sp.]|nr:MATE family efflux transporter [Eubacterium sp.]
MSENKLNMQNLSVGKLILYVLPTIIALLISSVYSIVDGVFVSNFGGTTAFAAINQVAPIFLVVASIGFMFGTGGTALVSKVQGEGDPERAKKIFSLITYTLIAIGITLSIVLWFVTEPFLRSLGTTDEMMPFCMAYAHIIIPAVTLFMLQFYFQSFFACAGKPKLGLIDTLLAGVVNIGGDALFVGVLANKDPVKSVQGAAYATALGLLVGGLFPLIYFFAKNSSSLRLGKAEFKLRYIGATCGNGISEFLTNVSASFINIVYNSLFLYMIGDMGVAAFGTVGYVNTIFGAIASGYAVGVAPLIAYNYGAKASDILKKLHKNSLVIVIGYSIIATIVIELVATPLASIFSHNDPDLLTITVDGLRIFTLSFLFKGIPTYGSGFFTALNDGFSSGFIAFMRTLVFNLATIIAVPLIFFYIVDAQKHGGMESYEAAYYGVWYSIVFSELLATLLTLLFFKVKKKKYQY